MKAIVQTNRRSFLKASSIAGLALTTSSASSARGSTSTRKYEVHAPAESCYQFPCDAALGRASTYRYGVITSFDVPAVVGDSLRAAIKQLYSSVQKAGQDLDRRITIEDSDWYPERGCAISVGFGGSLFKMDLGLQPSAPLELGGLPSVGDPLDPRQCDGHILLQVFGTDQVVAQAVTSRIWREVVNVMSIKWKREGNRPVARDSNAPRNLLGFMDGTANPSADSAAATRAISVSADNSDIPWMVGGTYCAIRNIALDLEKWNKLSERQQELIIGREKSSGALMAAGELSSHVQLARRNAGAAPMWRFGLNYRDSYPSYYPSGAGLLFIAYAASIEQQIRGVLLSLAQSDLLVKYSATTGSAVFAVPTSEGLARLAE